MIEELYNKIDKFCNETDWSKYPTYEHALEEFIKGIVAEETAELKEALKNDKVCKCSHYLNFKDLEKENAELKEKNKWYSEQVCNKECAEVWGQLTKAKEIIKEFVHHYKAKTIYIENMKDLLEQAEQFLSEVEK